MRGARGSIRIRVRICEPTRSHNLCSVRCPRLDKCYDSLIRCSGEMQQERTTTVGLIGRATLADQCVAGSKQILHPESSDECVSPDWRTPRRTLTRPSTTALGASSPGRIGDEPRTSPIGCGRRMTDD